MTARWLIIIGAGLLLFSCPAGLGFSAGEQVVPLLLATIGVLAGLTMLLIGCLKAVGPFRDDAAGFEPGRLSSRVQETLEIGFLDLRLAWSYMAQPARFHPLFEAVYQAE